MGFNEDVKKLKNYYKGDSKEYVANIREKQSRWKQLEGVKEWKSHPAAVELVTDLKQQIDDINLILTNDNEDDDVVTRKVLRKDRDRLRWILSYLEDKGDEAQEQEEIERNMANERAATEEEEEG